MEFERDGGLSTTSSLKTRMKRPNKDPIYAADFVARAKEKMVELSRDMKNPGLVWRKMQAWINGELHAKLSAIVGHGGEVSSRLVCRSEYQVKKYMKHLDYRWLVDTKGAYTDGHDRPDVVAARKEFIRKWRELELRMPRVMEFKVKAEDELPVGADVRSLQVMKECDDGVKEVSVLVYPLLTAGEKYVVPCFQDESTFHANDGSRHRWRLHETFMLMHKSRGQAIMVSGFMCPCHGEMEDLRETLEVGKNRDGYCDGEKFVAHFERVITKFRAAHPPVHDRKVESLFVFDNATGHKLFKKDALVAVRMGLNPGGKQPFMRNTVWHSTNENGEQVEHHQSMIVGPPPLVHSGQPKGAKLVLEERSLWPAGGLKLVCAKLKSRPDLISCRQHIQEGRIPPYNNCCARRVLELQPDFANEVSWVEQICRDQGVLSIYSPKFHPELNRTCFRV